MVNEPRFSSTFSEVIRGIWKSSIGVLRVVSCCGAPVGAPRAAPDGAGQGRYFEYSSTMSCSCTGAAISFRSGWRSTFAVRPSWSACKPGGNWPVSSVASRMTGSAAVPALTAMTSSGTHLVGGDVHATAVDRPVAVADELTGLAPRGREAEAHEHVVEAATRAAQQVLAGDAGLAAGLGVVDAELLLAARRSSGGPSASRAAARGTRSASGGRGRGRPAGRTAALDAALVGQAALALEEELLALAAALLALGTRCRGPSDAPPLAGTAAVVGLRGDVADRGDLEAGGLQRADGRLATGARALARRRRPSGGRAPCPCGPRRRRSPARRTAWTCASP